MATPEEILAELEAQPLSGEALLEELESQPEIGSANESVPYGLINPAPPITEEEIAAAEGAAGQGFLESAVGSLADTIASPLLLAKKGYDIATTDETISDNINALTNLPDEDKAKMLANLGGAFVKRTPLGALVSSVLAGLAAKTGTQAVLGKEITTGQNLGEATGELFAGGAATKVPQVLKNLKKGISSTEAARVRGAQPGGVASRFVSSDRAEGPKGLFRRLYKGEETFKKSGIIESVPKNSKVPLDDLEGAINRKLATIADDRNAILDSADRLGEQLGGLNRISYEDLDIPSSGIAAEVREMKGSGFEGADADAFQGYIDEMESSFFEKYSIVDPNTGAPAALPKEITIAELKNKIDRAYDELAENNKFSITRDRTKEVSNAEAIKDIAKTVYLEEFVKVAQKAIAKRIDGISTAAQKAGLVGERIASPRNPNFNTVAGEYLDLGTRYNHIRPYKDAVVRMKDEFGVSAGYSIPASAKELVGFKGLLDRTGRLLFGKDIGEAQRILKSAEAPSKNLADIRGALEGSQGIGASAPILNTIESAAPFTPLGGQLAGLDGASAVADVLGAESDVEQAGPIPVPVPTPVNPNIYGAISEIRKSPPLPEKPKITGYESEVDAGDGLVMIDDENDAVDLRDRVFKSNMPTSKKLSIIKSLNKGRPFDPNDLDTVETSRVKRRAKRKESQRVAEINTPKKLAEHGQVSKLIERRKEVPY